MIGYRMPQNYPVNSAFRNMKDSISALRGHYIVTEGSRMDGANYTDFARARLRCRAAPSTMA